LFSTTTGWPSRSFSLSAIVRPRTSIELPAGADMTNRIGLSGHVCASAGDAPSAAAATPATMLANTVNA
jgi:hypothetical protein